MRTRIVLVLILTVLAVLPGAATTAQDATPNASAADEAMLDLAAMILTPADLDTLGLPGFGLGNQSSLRDPATDAVVSAQGDAPETDQRLAAYRRDDFRYRYVGSLLRPRAPIARFPSGFVVADMRVTSSVSEYGTSAGAATGFAWVEDRYEDRPGRDVPGNRTFGEESELTRSSGTEAESGKPFERLELTFRLGNLVAEVTIVDYTDAEPEVATVEGLGEALRVKIERVRADGGPGLGFRVQRLAPLSPWIEGSRLRDFYTRLGREDRPTFADMVTGLEEGEMPRTGESSLAPELSGNSLDTYMFWTPVGGGDPLELPLYVVWLDRFASAEEAASMVDNQTTDLGEGYVDVEEVLDASRIGDASRTFAYRFEDVENTTVRGHAVIARVGDVVVRSQVDGPAGAPLAGVEELVMAQVGCLQAQGFCKPVPAPETLAGLRT